MQCQNICSDLVDEIFESATQKRSQLSNTVIPRFQSKRPLVNLTPPPSKYLKLSLKEEEYKSLKDEMKTLSSSLCCVTQERDHWRQATEDARRDRERLSLENNQLSLMRSELEEMVEEQGRVCTVLATDLLEVIWSLTGTSTPGTMDSLGQLPVINLCRIGVQALSQYRETAGLTELRMLTGLLGCLVNLSSNEHCLVVFLQTEEGCSLLKETCNLVCLQTPDIKLLELGMMLLINILESYSEYNRSLTGFSVDMINKVKTVANKWSLADRTRNQFREVAGRLAVLDTKWDRGVLLETEQ